jgi:hypothetical protein
MTARIRLTREDPPAGKRGALSVDPGDGCQPRLVPSFYRSPVAVDMGSTTQSVRNGRCRPIEDQKGVRDGRIRGALL